MAGVARGKAGEWGIGLSDQTCLGTCMAQVKLLQSGPVTVKKRSEAPCLWVTGRGAAQGTTCNRLQGTRLSIG